VLFLPELYGQAIEASKKYLPSYAGSPLFQEPTPLNQGNALQQGIKPPFTQPVGVTAKKTIVQTFKSPSTGKTKIVYNDGTEEIR
jgi:hypothetical protein